MRKILAAICLLNCTISMSGQGPVRSLEISHLTGDFYIYTTYNLYKNSRIPANGMYVVTEKGVILIDSPWDTTQFQPLADSIEARHQKKVVLCIATHFHEDRTAGLEFYKKQGAQTYTTKLTDELSNERGMKRAEFLMEKDTTMTVGQYSFLVYYPGKGHAPDNIVIWFKKEKILYGGCLIKSAKDQNLGNLGDADTKAYATTLMNVKRKCRRPKYIIPGHNDWTDKSSLDHTLEMAKQLAETR